MSWILVLRWLHVITATAWIGQVLVIAFVLVPIVAKESKAEVQLDLLRRIFPPVFRLGSILSGIAVIAGVVLLWDRIAGLGGEFFASWQNHALLTGSILGILVMGLHHAVEPRLRRMLRGSADQDDASHAAAIVRRLKILPRVGLTVLTLAAVLMMIGARGI